MGHELKQLRRLCRMDMIHVSGIGRVTFYHLWDCIWMRRGAIKLRSSTPNLMVDGQKEHMTRVAKHNSSAQIMKIMNICNGSWAVHYTSLS